jgi:hypothetical protein
METADIRRTIGWEAQGIGNVSLLICWEVFLVVEICAILSREHLNSTSIHEDEEERVQNVG